MAAMIERPDPVGGPLDRELEAVSPAAAYRRFRTAPGDAGADGFRRRVRLRLRRLPARGLRPPGGRLGRPGRRADRGGQDHRRRVRDLAGAAAGPQGVLHHPDQGPVEPEVRRPGPPSRRGQRRAADRGLQHQLRGAGGGDDHRGAAEHDLRQLRDAGQPRLRGDGRGALPRRPVPRRGLGRGHHRPGRVDPAGGAVRHRQQRRGVRRLAVGGPRRDGGGRLRATSGAAVPARAGRQAALRPVRRRGADRGRAAQPGQRARSTRPWSRSARRRPGTSGTTPAARGVGAARASARWRTAAGRTAGPPTGRGPRRGPVDRGRWPWPPGPTWSPPWTPRHCCPRSSSSSPGSAATRPSDSCSAPACG